MFPVKSQFTYLFEKFCSKIEIPLWESRAATMPSSDPHSCASTSQSQRGLLQRDTWQPKPIVKSVGNNKEDDWRSTVGFVEAAKRL